MYFDSSCSYNSSMTLIVVQHFPILTLIYALLIYELHLFLVIAQKILVSVCFLVYATQNVLPILIFSY